MKILYTTKEGGILKPLEINPEKGKEIFAIYLPDGIIWDTLIGVDELSSLFSSADFDELYSKRVAELENKDE